MNVLCEELEGCVKEGQDDTWAQVFMVSLQGEGWLHPLPPWPAVLWAPRRVSIPSFHLSPFPLLEPSLGPQEAGLPPVDKAPLALS